MPSARSARSPPTGELVGLTRDFDADLCVPGRCRCPRRRGHRRRRASPTIGARATSPGSWRPSSAPWPIAGIAVGLLVAAEWPIYGRFGYGPAIDACGFDIDTRTARFLAEPTGIHRGGACPSELRPELERVHELRRRRTPGVDHPARPRSGTPRRRAVAGRAARTIRARSAARCGATPPARCRAPSPTRSIDHWERNRPAGKAEVTLLVGATPEAERELWRHLCEIDWIATVTAGNRGVDDPLQLMLADGRVARSGRPVRLHLGRLLDVPAALGARRSLHADRVVVEVDDPQGFASGRWSIELAPDGAEVKPSDETADVALSATPSAPRSSGAGRCGASTRPAGSTRRRRRRRSPRRAALHAHRTMVTTTY